MFNTIETWLFIAQFILCFVIMLMIARGDLKGKHGDRQKEVQNGGQYGCYYEKGE